MEEFFDFSNEDDSSVGGNFTGGERKEYGPVPAGSAVICRFELQRDNGSAVRRANSGLKQLGFKIVVTRGKYKDVFWFQNITCPVGMQDITLKDGQRKNCMIAGKFLKDLLVAAGKPTNSPLSAFDGLTVPVIVSINNKSTVKVGKDGVSREYWRNEAHKVVLPTAPEFARIQQAGEIIKADGAVVGKPKQSQDQWGNYGKQPAQSQQSLQQQYQQIANQAFGSEDTTSQIPF